MVGVGVSVGILVGVFVGVGEEVESGLRISVSVGSLVTVGDGADGTFEVDTSEIVAVSLPWILPGMDEASTPVFDVLQAVSDQMKSSDKETRWVKNFSTIKGKVSLPSYGKDFNQNYRDIVISAK
jgi:hypothetical protein